MTAEPAPRPTLAEFLLARLAEDEAVAKAAQRTTGPRWDQRRYSVVVDEFEVVEGNVKTAEHIARHDPARVLAEVAAKRAIVEWDAQQGVEYAPLRLLAQPYADHPDFRDEWRA